MSTAAGMLTYWDNNPGIRAPRCIGMRDFPGESTWLWLEDIGDMPGTPWRVQGYYGLWIAWLAGMLALEDDGHTKVTTFFDRPVDAVVEQFSCLVPLLLAHVDEAQALL